MSSMFIFEIKKKNTSSQKYYFSENIIGPF